MGVSRRRIRSLAGRTVALTAALALLSSSLLAAGAHEHLAPQRSDTACAVDHQGRGPVDQAEMQAAARPHRHHCASCQLAAQSRAETPAGMSLAAHVDGGEGLVGRTLLVERRPVGTAAAPRGPPVG